MGFYDLEGEDAVEVIVLSLKARDYTEDQVRHGMQDMYRTGGMRGDYEVAQFVDTLLCEIQERIGDAEVHWSGHYWDAACDKAFGEGDEED